MHLWRVSSVSSAPLLEPDEDDDADDFDTSGIGGSKGEAADIRVSTVWAIASAHTVVHFPDPLESWYMLPYWQGRSRPGWPEVAGFLTDGLRGKLFMTNDWSNFYTYARAPGSTMAHRKLAGHLNSSSKRYYLMWCLFSYYRCARLTSTKRAFIRWHGALLMRGSLLPCRTTVKWC